MDGNTLAKLTSKSDIRYQFLAAIRRWTTTPGVETRIAEGYGYRKTIQITLVWVPWPLISLELFWFHRDPGNKEQSEFRAFDEMQKRGWLDYRSAKDSAKQCLARGGFQAGLPVSWEYTTDAGIIVSVRYFGSQLFYTTRSVKLAKRWPRNQRRHLLKDGTAHNFEARVLGATALASKLYEFRVLGPGYDVLDDVEDHNPGEDSVEIDRLIEPNIFCFRGKSIALRPQSFKIMKLVWNAQKPISLQTVARQVWDNEDVKPKRIVNAVHKLNQQLFEADFPVQFSVKDEYVIQAPAS